MLVALASLVDTLVQRGSAGVFNDFYDYWLAATVVRGGGNPYDIATLTAAVGHAGIHYTVGTGYSYPVLFAYLCVPLTALAPLPAAVVFAGLSLAALGLAVALLVTPMRQLGVAELLLLGALAGGLTPVAGSLYFGQVNLLLLPLLALAWRGAWRPLGLGLATAVKLYPAAALAAMIAAGRRGFRPLAATASVMAALTILPNLASAKSGGAAVSSLFGPDPFWTNQSLNGWVSRISTTSEFTRPPLPGLPVVPVEVLLVVLVGVAVLAVLLRCRGEPWPGCLALAISFGVVAAPKNSLWNYAPLVLVLFYCWPLVRRRPPLLVLLVVGLGLVEVQAVVDYFRQTFYSSPALTWLSSLALYGALVLMALNAYLLLESGREPKVETDSAQVLAA